MKSAVMITAERTEDSLFGAKLLVKADSLEYIYDGRYAFEVHHRLKQIKQVNPSIFHELPLAGWIQGELFLGYEPEAFHGQVSRSENAAKYDVICYDKSNEGKAIRKCISINRMTGIPEIVETTAVQNGMKEINRLVLSEIATNSRSVPRVDSRMMAFIDKYALLPVEDIGIPVVRDARDSLLGTMAQDFALKSMADKTVQLSDLRGSVVLLDFWEVWCGPCRMSMPHLQELHERYKDKGLVVLGIAKDNVMGARGLLLNKKVTYDNLIGSAEVNKSYKVNEIPQYYLIGRDGVIIYASRNGYEKRIDDMIDSLCQ